MQIRYRKGFTLVELLVVISVISVLMGILLPAFYKIRYHARSIVSMSNQKQTVTAVNLFAVDNDDKYPASVCITGADDNWNWNDPRTLASWNTAPSHPHRAMSAYLNGYITKASTMVCPQPPQKFKYLQQAWDAGDNWQNPDNPGILVFRGSYCFYWNYDGWINDNKNFIGPKGPSAAGRGQSKLLMSCYFGYDHRSTPDDYGSCEPFQNSRVESESLFDSSWWTCHAENVDVNSINIKLNAAYTDGHVETFTPSQALPMKAIMTRSTNQPYPSGMGPGDFYIPANALH